MVTAPDHESEVQSWFLELALLAPSANIPAMDCRAKIIPIESLAEWRQKVRASNKKLVVTNGCFDLLHAGHITYLEAARNMGDALLVGVTGDSSVRQLKGAGRPLTIETDRALVLAALESVNAACIFAELTAIRFLTLAQPDIYVKGGDNTLATINQEERQLVEKMGGKVVIAPGVPGKSTTALVDKILKL